MKQTIKALFATILSAVLAFSFTGISYAQNSNLQLIKQPGYYRMQVGDADVTVLSDGTTTLDMGQLLFNAQPGEIQQLFEQNFLTPTSETSDNAYLIHSNNKLILIDAGTGDLMGGSVGQLTKSLANAGYRPEQIDAILITHMHLDHVGGLIKNGSLVFPNATVYFSKPEGDYWLSEENLKNAPEGLKPFFEAAQKSVLPYVKAGKVKIFAFGTELFPGITAISTVGHTPGHTSYLLQRKGEKMMFLGDLVHAEAVQFTDPEVAIHFDYDSKQAIQTRRKAFDDAVAGKYIIAASHLPFPGLGKLRANGKSYIWVPVNYVTIAAK